MPRKEPTLSPRVADQRLAESLRAEAIRAAGAPFVRPGLPEAARARLDALADPRNPPTPGPDAVYPPAWGSGSRLDPVTISRIGERVIASASLTVAADGPDAEQRARAGLVDAMVGAVTPRDYGAYAAEIDRHGYHPARRHDRCPTCDAYAPRAAVLLVIGAIAGAFLTAVGCAAVWPGLFA